jgi:predicted small metal-binding protein
MAEEKSSRGAYSIRCMEFGDVNCNWEGYGRDENEVMREAERHGREKHEWTSFTEEMKNKARGSIRKRAA